MVWLVVKINIMFVSNNWLVLRADRDSVMADLEVSGGLDLLWSRQTSFVLTQHVDRVGLSESICD